VPPSDQRRSHAIFNWLFSALFVKNWPFCDQNIDVFYWLILKLFRPFGFFDRFKNCNFFDENYQNTRKMWVFDVISCLFSETTSMEYYMKTNFKFSQKTKTVLIRFVNHQKGQILLLWIISNNEKEKEKKDTLAIIIHLIIHRYDNTNDEFRSKIGVRWLCFGSFLPKSSQIGYFRVKMSFIIQKPDKNELL